MPKFTEPWRGTWEVVSDLGKGGQGHTKKVRRKGTPADAEFYALKVLIRQDDGERRERMQREVCALRSLDHANEPERLRLSVEVRTGLYFDENSLRAQLNQAQWLERRAQLNKLGGFCDVRFWDDVSEAQKLELRTPMKK